MALDPVAQNDPHVPAHNAEREAINALEADVAKMIPNPTIKALGSTLRWDGDNWVASKLRLYEGVGSPEGVVSAPIGARYLDSNATAGVSEWFKASGAGNTGWLEANSSVPWTNVSLGSGWAHAPGFTAQYSVLMGAVYLRGGLRRTSGTGAAMGSIPLEVAPKTNLAGHARIGNAVTPLLIAIAASGAMSVSGSIVANTDIYLDSFTCAPYRR